jgi:hypothetical protein
MRAGYVLLPRLTGLPREIDAGSLLQEVTRRPWAALEDRLTSFDCTEVNAKVLLEYRRCHENCITAWLEGLIDTVATGYYHCPSGMWAEHTSATNRKGKLVELTNPDPCDAYFGVTLTRDECGEMARVLIEDDNPECPWMT